jgi:endonuclease/exonuclease/phosphatase family metal-dependent hydrolase
VSERLAVTGGPSTGFRIRVATYNIHGCLGRDGRRDPERVASVIREELAAEVVALQEVYAGGADLGVRDQFDVLGRETRLDGSFVPALSRDGLLFGNALLTSFPILSTERFDVSFGPRERRAVLDVRLEIPRVAGATLRVVVAHLGLAAGERRYQVGRLVDLVLGGERRGEVVVLLGDLNEWNPLARSLRPLRRHFGPHRALPTFPSRLPLLSLDRVLVLPPATLTDCHVVSSRRAREASDHLPLAGTLSISGGED